MAQAIAGQVVKLSYSNTFTDCTNEPAAELAAKLAEFAPGLAQSCRLFDVWFLCERHRDTTRSFLSSRRGEPERRMILSRHNSYHGSTYLGMTLGKRDGDRSPHFQYIDGLVHHLGAPYAYRRPDGMSEAQFTDHLVDELQAAIRNIGARTSRPSSPSRSKGREAWYRRRPDTCRGCARCWRSHGILFVADEVVTGFGRIGHWFASYDESESNLTFWLRPRA